MFDGYRFKTANDTNARDPVGWRVRVSNDGTNWVTLDEQSAQTIPTTRNTFVNEYSI
jgi:hypothetical protein